MTTLRILGVRSEPPSVRPGATSELSVLCADGRPNAPGRPQCAVEIAWFSGCHNPPNASPLRCLEEIGRQAAMLPDPVAAAPTGSGVTGFFGMGDHFVFHAPGDILTQQIDVGGLPIRYGLSYVFFAACAGTLHPVPGVKDRLPLECRDPSSGQPVGQDRFVVGHTTIYSYDAIENRNPIIDSVTLDGLPIDPSPCMDDTGCQAQSVCRAGACVPRITRCQRGQTNDECLWRHSFEAKITLDSFLIRPLVEIPPGVTEHGLIPPKSIWVNYYATAGHLSIHDIGFDPSWYGSNPQPSLWVPPANPDPDVRLWAVVRDDHGGLAWVERRVVVE